MDEKSILEEIKSAFSLSEMPSAITPQIPRFIESEEIDEVMEKFRGHPASVEMIRSIHSYIPILSPEAILWILPYYLNFCLSDEGRKYSRKEAASLISFLSPHPEFVKETIFSLSLLNHKQFICLCHFLEWCQTDKYWDDFILEDISRGMFFCKARLL